MSSKLDHYNVYVGAGPRACPRDYTGNHRGLPLQKSRTSPTVRRRILGVGVGAGLPRPYEVDVVA